MQLENGLPAKTGQNSSDFKSESASQKKQKKIDEMDELDPVRIAEEILQVPSTEVIHCDCSCIAPTKTGLPFESYKSLGVLNFWKAKLTAKSIQVAGGEKVQNPKNHLPVFLSLKNTELGPKTWNKKIHVETAPEDTDLVRLELRSILDNVAARTCLSSKRSCGCDIYVTQVSTQTRTATVSFASGFQSARGVSRWNANRGSGILGAVRKVLTDAQEMILKGKTSSNAYKLLEENNPFSCETKTNPIANPDRKDLKLLWDHIEPTQTSRGWTEARIFFNTKWDKQLFLNLMGGYRSHASDYRMVITDDDSHTPPRTFCKDCSEPHSDGKCRYLTIGLQVMDISIQPR